MTTGMNKTPIIYALHDGDFRYRYVGQTLYPRKRMNEHLYNAKQGSMYPVYKWIRKHGPESIRMEILGEYVDLDELNE
jgi:hypothetical protein